MAGGAAEHLDTAGNLVSAVQVVDPPGAPAEYPVQQNCNPPGGRIEDESMLEVMELSKKYGKNLAADKVGFTVPDGKTGILLGPNGAGKSTVIKSIAGLLNYKGTVRIQGMDSLSSPKSTAVRYSSRRCAG